MNEELKKEVIETLKQYHIGVLSTVSEEVRPQAAIVGFTVNDNLELFFGTSRKTRKYANLQHNSKVAFAIGDFTAEVQLEGEAREMTLEVALDKFGHTPGIEKYRDDPDQTWWLVAPTWLRLTVHAAPDRVEEMRIA
jgi:general stress protein 26